MKHFVVYQGPYSQNISRLLGARTYIARDGSEHPYRIRAGADGVRFGLLQKADGEGFFIARVQFQGKDLVLRKPVTADGTGPNGTWLTRAGALKYLERLARANPTMRKELAGIAELVRTSSDT